jgi:hypothetical protein
VCSAYCILEGIVNRAVSICSDSRAVLLVLKTYAVSSRVYYSTEILFRNWLSLTEFDCGIHGNEEADALAGAGSSSAFVFRIHMVIGCSNGLTEIVNK